MSKQAHAYPPCTGECCQHIGAGNPWSDFLHHRMRALAWLRDEMKNTPEQICEAMAMDPEQVRLILMTFDQGWMRAGTRAPRRTGGRR